MKYVHIFATQKEAVLYFLRVLIAAGSYGSDKSNKKLVEGFKHDLGFAEKKRFRNPFRRFPAATAIVTDHLIASWYRRTAAPILEFYGTVLVNKGQDELANPNFSANIQAGTGEPLTGSLIWCAISTEGRLINIVFAADGSATMTYNLGIRGDRPVLKSGFLGLPLPGDKIKQDKQ